MKAAVKIPNNVPYKKVLLVFIEQLQTFISIDSIYLSQRETKEDSPHYMVTILTSVDIKHIPPKLLVCANQFSHVHTNIKIRVYGSSCAAIAFKKGCSFFIEHLLFGQCIYGDQVKWLADFQMKKIPEIFQLTKNHITYDLQKINAFLCAAKMHKEQQAFELASFNYHQSIELLFRLAEWLIIGKSKITHRIVDHINYFQSFDDAFSSVVDLEDTKNKELFEKLDSSYSKARYCDEFTVSESFLEQFHEKAIQLLSISEKRFAQQNRYIQQLFNKYTLEDKKRKPKPLKGTLLIEEPQLIKAIHFLKKKYGLQNLYLIHQQSQSTIQRRYSVLLSDSKSIFNTYTVLLFTNKEIQLSPDKLTDTLYHISDRECKIYCICYTVGEAMDAMQEGDNFLCHIRGQAKEVYHHKFSLKELRYMPVYYKPLWKQMYTTWHIRYKRAQYLSSIFQHEQFWAVSSAQLPLLHTALCQIHLGLLFVFWEFTPRQYSLPYLLQLCKALTVVPYKGFDFTTVLPPNWYVPLLKASKQLKKANHTTVSKEEVNQAAQLCNECLDHCRQLVEAELERVKPLYFRVENKA